MKHPISRFLINILSIYLFGSFGNYTAGKNQTAEVKEALPTKPLSHFDKMHAKDLKVVQQNKNFDLVMIGDSITNGWDNSDKQDLLKEAFPNFSILNLGISGDTTQGVLWRLHDGVLNDISTKVVMVMIGTNNLRTGKSENIALGIKEVTKALRSKVPKAKILLLGLFPRGRDAKNGWRLKTIEVNKIIQDLDDSHTVIYKDIGKAFLDKYGYLSEDISKDALHLTAEGYNRWVETVKPLILKLAKNHKNL